MEKTKHEIALLVAAHKKYAMPDDQIYLPVHVGAAGKESIGFTRDDTGENISSLNPYFCELTGIYWAWKNLDANYIGLAHYRRHFKGRIPFLKKYVLGYDEAKDLFRKTDIILPKKRRYYIENLYNHYVHTLAETPLVETEKVIEESFPEYYPQFERLRKRTSAHMFNMFIMSKDRFDEYCEFLFGVLFKLQERVNVADYDAFQARFFGRISELLLDVWLLTKEYGYKEVGFVNIEGDRIWTKGIALIKAKLFRKKYKQSF